jgi:hypothetical protein
MNTSLRDEKVLVGELIADFKAGRHPLSIDGLDTYYSDLPQQINGVAKERVFSMRAIEASDDLYLSNMADGASK